MKQYECEEYNPVLWFAFHVKPWVPSAYQQLHVFCHPNVRGQNQNPKSLVLNVDSYSWKGQGSEWLLINTTPGGIDDNRKWSWKSTFFLDSSNSLI